MRSEITAIVTTRNRLAFLERALTSVAVQDVAALETIVVDDASENAIAVARLVAKFGAKCIHMQIRRGASAARNLGTVHARGRVVAFLDDDDEWLPSYLAAVRRTFSARSADVAACGFLRHAGGADEPEKEAPPDLVFEEFLVRNPGIRASNLSIKRQQLLSLGGWNESLPSMNDMDLGARLARSGLRYVPIAERLVRFHDHDGSRLSTPRTRDKALGVRHFYELYRSSMTESQQQFFRDKTRSMWGVTVDA